MFDMNKAMGRKVRDTITGFTGIVTGYCTYISGCNQVLVCPQVDENGRWIEANWIDEQRLEFLVAETIVLDNSRARGADKPAPIR